MCYVDLLRFYEAAVYFLKFPLPEGEGWACPEPVEGVRVSISVEKPRTPFTPTFFRQPAREEIPISDLGMIA